MGSFLRQISAKTKPSTIKNRPTAPAATPSSKRHDSAPASRPISATQRLGRERAPWPVRVSDFLACSSSASATTRSCRKASSVLCCSMTKRRTVRTTSPGCSPRKAILSPAASFLAISSRARVTCFNAGVVLLTNCSLSSARVAARRSA